jgi:hypothetical protein
MLLCTASQSCHEEANTPQLPGAQPAVGALHRHVAVDVVHVGGEVHVLLLLLLPVGLPPPRAADDARCRPARAAALPPREALCVHRVPARPARQDRLRRRGRGRRHLLEAHRARRAVERPPRRRRVLAAVGGLAAGRPGGPELVEPLPGARAGEHVRVRGRGDESRDLARAQRLPPDAGLVEGEAEDAEQDEEDVLAGHGGVRARARRGGGQRHRVHVSRGAEHEELRPRAVQQPELVLQRADDAVRHAPRRRLLVHRRRGERGGGGVRRRHRLHRGVARRIWRGTARCRSGWLCNAGCSQKARMR